MRYSLIVWIAITTIFTMSSLSFACEPCPDQPHLNSIQSVQKAEFILLGQPTKALPVESDPTPKPQGISFEIQQVIKSPIESTLTKTTMVIHLAKSCPNGFLLKGREPVVLLSSGPNANGVYQVLNQGCAATHFPVDHQGYLGFDGQRISLKTLLRLSDTKFEVKALTLNPKDLSYNEKNATVTFLPNSRVRRSRYTHYTFDLKSFESVLGQRPITSQTILVELEPPQKKIHKADPSLPQPDGGFRITKHTGQVIAVIEN